MINREEHQKRGFVPLLVKRNAKPDKEGHYGTVIYRKAKSRRHWQDSLHIAPILKVGIGEPVPLKL